VNGPNRLLWLGGGVRFDTLEVIEATIRQRAENEKDGPVKVELMNLANAAYSELTRRPEPACDLI
jgi:hypothetical protein